MREPEILVDQQHSQGVFVGDHAGLVIDEFPSSPRSLAGSYSTCSAPGGGRLVLAGERSRDATTVPIWSAHNRPPSQAKTLPYRILEDGASLGSRHEGLAVYLTLSIKTRRENSLDSKPRGDAGVGVEVWGIGFQVWGVLCRGYHSCPLQDDFLDHGS